VNGYPKTPLAFLLCSKGFYDEAVVLLNKAIKGEKKEKGLYINRGGKIIHYHDNYYINLILLQWNPINMVTNKKFGHINKGFLQENVWPFCCVGKKSGHNNEVTRLPRWQ